MNAAAASHVTICVPVYNSAAYVAETLASIERQTHRNFTVVVLDDASTDRSLAICETFARDPRFRIEGQAAHGGWIENCNRAMARATGEYVCLMPHDDLIDERYLETLVAALAAAPDCIMAFCDVQVFGLMDDVCRQESIAGDAPERTRSFIATHFDGTAFRGLIRRKALTGVGGLRHNPIDNFAADVSWLGRIAQAGGMQRVPMQLYRKRRHNLSVSMQWRDWSDEARATAWTMHCRELLRDALRLPLTDAERAAIVRASLRRVLAIEPLRPFTFIRAMPPARQAAMAAELIAELEGAGYRLGALGLGARDAETLVAACRDEQ